MTGVRAEPKYLRDPTSFETLSSGLSRLSSYVTSNLPKRKPTFPPYLPAQDPQLLFYQQQLLQQQRSTAAINNNNNNNNNNLTTDNNNATTTNKDEDNDSTETITFASFEKFDSHLGKVSCLLLGYEQGFQLWNVSQPDNVHELASIRLDNIGIVTKLHVLSTPALSPSKQDQYKDKRPLLAIISTNQQDAKTPHESAGTTSNQISPSLPPQDSTSKTTKSLFHLYSLKTHEFIPLNLNISEDTVITDVKSNGKIIVLGCKNQNQSSIQLLSSYDLSTAYTTLTDVSHQPDGPVFTLGSRLLAYATTLQVLNNDTNNTNADKDVKEAAKDIAKEMVNGVKSLGEFGYNRLSNYFSQNNQEMASMNSNSNNINNINMNNPTPSPYYNPSMSSPSSESRDMPSISSSSTTSTTIQKQTPTGMVIIRDISKLPTSSIKSNTLSLSTVAHFKPHSHPIAILSFNAAGNLLMSVSKQGHTFHIFSMYPTDRHLANAAHLYNLSRGYTDARVVDCQFSIDSTWCAVTTARGTTHMYTINPYGGKPEISAHVNGKINNLVNPPFVTKKKPFVTSLGPAVRVKQRRPLYTDSSALSENQGLETNSAPPNGIYPSSAIPSSSPSPPLFYNSQRWQPTTTITKTTKSHRADLTTMFLSVTHVPTTLQGNQNHHHHHTSPQSSHIPNSNQLSKVSSPLPPPATLTSIKNQASTLVSQVSSYLPNAQRDWTWAKDKSNDNRMFGFDEEESTLDDDSATKIINDSTGYQDVYSFHPTGVLTLHRLWVTKSMVKKRVQGRTVGKWDLSVKEEDIAEWQIARNLDWQEVTIPIHGSNSSSSLGTTLWKDDSDEDENDSNNNTIYEEKNILSEIQESEELTDSSNNSHHNNNTSSTKKKKKQKTQNKNDQNSNDNNKNKNIDPSPSSSSSSSNNNNNKDNNNMSQQVTNHWLSHAEIMTYANNTTTQDPPLWSNPQFTFQIYTESNNKESKTPSSSSIASMLSSGIVPPTVPLVVRSETPEPYTSRINRIGKTNAVARSLDNEENMDDALAELEENLSTAMQTSFVPSSTTASPRHSSMKLSSSAGTQPSTQRKSRSDQISSLSFENAYLISMGGVPVYRATNHNNYQKQNDEDDDENNNNNNNNNINRIYQPTTSTSSPVHLSTSMQGSSLIQFDSDNDIDMNSNSSINSNMMNHSSTTTTNVNSNNNDNGLNNSMSKMMIMEDQRSENNVNIASSSSLLGSFGIQGLDDGDDSIRLVGDDDDKDFGDIVFSPDGDNEIEYPSDSVVFGR
ncbi:hypothetical protein BJ944DRAFT_176517 [Cunninghamella echinulata]|nr:hypothetical protein BJ944DRAFT_176517 [Cunninghamella echinulata]